jgi:hypothetical protein
MSSPMNASSGLRAVIASVEREVSRLSRLQGAREKGTPRGAAWSKLVGLQNWARSPGIARDRYGASAAFAQLRGAAVLDQGLAARRASPTRHLAHRGPGERPEAQARGRSPAPPA